MLNIELGNRIYDRRKELGLTMDDVASKIGVAKSTIQRYEKGQIAKVKMPVVESIAAALNVNPAWLIGKSDIKEIPDYKQACIGIREVFNGELNLRTQSDLIDGFSEKDLQIFEMLPNASEEQKARIVQFIKFTLQEE